MDERKELNQKELSEVSGGYRYTTVDGKHYCGFGDDVQNKYLCPKCGRPVHPGKAWRFYCDPGDESQFFENSLLPNLKSGYWEEMTEEEWEKMQSENRRAIDKCKRESQ